MATPRSVEVQLAPDQFKSFTLLLQQGVEVEVETGCSIKQLLTGQFGISADYISERITTLFLNSRAVDNAATALVGDGAVLALSGAMPGLVGATMRSGGYYAAMRGAMTYRGAEEVPSARQGRIRLKLFNLLLQELGPGVLARGIVLAAERLLELFAEQPETLRPLKLRVDGRPVEIEQPGQCREMADAGEMLKLKVYFGD